MSLTMEEEYELECLMNFYLLCIINKKIINSEEFDRLLKLMRKKTDLNLNFLKIIYSKHLQDLP